MEDIGAERFVEPSGRHVVANVGIAHARRHARRACGASEQARLPDTISPPSRKHLTGAVARRVRHIDIGIVDDTLAHRFIKGNCASQLIMHRTGRCASEFAHVCGVAVDERSRLEIDRFLRYRHQLIPLKRSPLAVE